MTTNSSAASAGTPIDLVNGVYAKLPKNVATVFTMREVDGVESKDICTMLNISESNLWVMLHRARMALQRCLETNWFGK